MPQFKEGNTEAAKRGKNKRTLYLNALAKELGLNNSDKAEEEFYKFCVKVALGSYGDEAKPDTQLLRECLRRLYPEPKSTMPTYNLDMPDNLERLQKAEFIFDAQVSGDIPPDIGSLLMGELAAVAKVEEVDVLSEDLRKIKEHLGLE